MLVAMQKDLGRLWHMLVLRGAAMLALGLAAMIWPEGVLVDALVGVGILATVFGLYEMTIAVGMRRLTSNWWLVLVHGAAAVAFGALTIGAPALTLRAALAVIAAWMLVYAGVAWIAAAVARPLHRVRWVLVVWGALDVALAVIAVRYPEGTIFALLFFGAAYAALLGAWEIATGLWLRHFEIAR